MVAGRQHRAFIGLTIGRLIARRIQIRRVRAGHHTTSSFYHVVPSPARLPGYLPRCRGPPLGQESHADFDIETRAFDSTRLKNTPGGREKGGGGFGLPVGRNMEDSLPTLRPRRIRVPEMAKIIFQDTVITLLRRCPLRCAVCSLDPFTVIRWIIPIRVALSLSVGGSYFNGLSYTGQTLGMITLRSGSMWLFRFYLCFYLYSFVGIIHKNCLLTFWEDPNFFLNSAWLGFYSETCGSSVSATV